MTKIASRASSLAIVPEVTEGTLVAPTSANQYTALQDDAKFSFGIETKESAELVNSLAPAAPIPGAESPKFDFSHYMKASGTAGTAPDYNDLMKGFFGAETANGTERSTAAASTVSLIKVGAGIGASDFPRGAGMLIQDATNGYRIRVVHTQTVDDLSLSFDLPAAPGTGVKLGKCVFWSPVDSGHQSLSIWYYLGGGVVQAMAGAKVTSFQLDATAGDLVNASFSLEGLSGYLNPIYISAASKFVDFTDDDGTVAASVSEGWYKSPNELAEAIQTAMQLVQSGETATVEYDNATGKFTIACTGTVVSVLWNTGTNTANTIAAKIGFSAAADSTAALTYTGATTISTVTPYTPAIDSTSPNIAKNNEVMFGTQSEYNCFHASKVSFSGADGKALLGDICAESGSGGAVINERTGKVTITAYLEQYNSKEFYRFQKGDTVRFQYSWGPKVGGRWVAGKCQYLYLPLLKISSFAIDEADGLAQLTIEAATYADPTDGKEMYVGCV